LLFRVIVGRRSAAVNVAKRYFASISSTRLPGPVQRDQQRLLARPYRLAIDRQNDITREQSGLGRRTVIDHLGQDNAGTGVDAESIGFRAGQLIRLESNPAANHPSLAFDLIDNTPNQIDRYGKADSLGACVLRKYRGVYADQLSERIDQCTARSAFVDGGVCLNEILKGIQAEQAATCCAALGDSFGQAIRITDRQYDVTDSQLVRSSERDRRQFAQVDFKNRQIGLCVDPYDSGAGNTSVGHLHTDFAGVGNDMVVGYQVAVGIEDHSDPRLVLVRYRSAAPSSPRARTSRRV
jgi:hypothetical protein